MPIAQHGSMLEGAADVDFAALSNKLPTGRDPESTAQRKALFRRFDVNGNGFLSLAEVDKAVGDAIGDEYLASSKPVIARAFAAAKDMGSDPHSNSDYVEKSEFRLLLVYLRQFFEMYVAYNRLDASDDRRLSLPEFRKGVGLLAQWGIDIDDDRIDAEFASIDANGGGIVLFDEFCDWAIKKQLDLEDATTGARTRRRRRRRRRRRGRTRRSSSASTTSAARALRGHLRRRERRRAPRPARV